LCPIAALLLLAACGGAVSTTSDRSSAGPDASGTASRVRGVADDYFAAWKREFPLGAAFNGVPGAANDRLGDNSLEAMARWQQREDRWLAELRAIDPTPLRHTPDEATYGTLRELLEASRQTRVCHAELWPLSQLNGWQNYLPVVAQIQPLGNDTLRAQALARWRAVPVYLDRELAALRKGVQEGYTLPRTNVQAVLQQLDDILKLPPPESPFARLAARDAAPGFRDSVVAIVGGAILPAIRRYRDYVAGEYLPRARTTTDVSSLPHGAECYQAQVRSFTTVDVAPRALHELGLREMDAIDRELRPIAERSFGTGDLPALMDRLRNDPQYLLTDRAELIRTAEAAVARAKAAMPKWFGRLPKSDVLVDPCQPYEEKSGCPNSYLPGTPDGSRPGRWRINAATAPPQPRAILEATAFHETIPGHHLQGAIAQEREGAHPITRYFGFSGYTEGWALYAEWLAMEMDLYSSDLERIGELGSQALRAARLVVDPGLHVLGWSRQQAIDYMLAHVPDSRQNIESEVDRYIAWPGQATSYMVGRIQIDSLRARAEARLGPKFDIRAFHDHLLANGAVPLGLLRSDVDAWVDSVAGPATP
jgi:uncharacterized protein (DUF885 family)